LKNSSATKAERRG